MTFKKILCPIDFSPGSQQAMRTAVRLANERDAELVLVHSWYLPPVAFSGDYVYAADIVQQLSDDAQRSLEAAVGEAGKMGARRVTSKLLTGLPWQQIVDAAKREAGLGLIVIGTHGRTGLSRVLLGSVAELVVRHAPCPVLTVRPHNEPAPFAHVLCPVDLSRPARDAMNLAAELAPSSGAGITLLHVLELPVSYTGKLPLPDFHRDLDVRSAALLDQWTTDLKAKVAVPVTQLTRIGRPGAQILSVLEDDRTFDLVVMGSHGHTGVERMLLGSVAEKIVRHARCPVLVAHSSNPAHSGPR
jgi:nucleotide-binding universal stress UspA family protein